MPHACYLHPDVFAQAGVSLDLAMPLLLMMLLVCHPHFAACFLAILCMLLASLLNVLVMLHVAGDAGTAECFLMLLQQIPIKEHVAALITHKVLALIASIASNSATHALINLIGQCCKPILQWNHCPHQKDQISNSLSPSYNELSFGPYSSMHMQH